MIFRYFTVITLLMSFLSCREGFQGTTGDVKKEVDDRYSVLKQLSGNNDSLSVALSLFGQEINRLLLLSKDVENPGAAVSEGNGYFEKQFADLGIRQEFRVLFTPLMNTREMELHIRENELSVLNELVFLNSGGAVNLSAVKESDQ